MRLTDRRRLGGLLSLWLATPLPRHYSPAMRLVAEMQVFDFTWLSQPEAWIALLTLGVLEIVLGIDNIVFISILVDKVPPSQQPKARVLGLGLAMLTRIALLFTIK